MSHESLMKKDPMGYQFFRLEITRSNLYVNYLRRIGTQWLGLVFYYPPIWCSSLQYRVTQLQNEHQDTTISSKVDKNNGSVWGDVDSPICPILQVALSYLLPFLLFSIFGFQTHIIPQLQSLRYAQSQSINMFLILIYLNKF